MSTEEEPIHEVLGHEVYTALRNNAPAGWLVDYVELFGEYPGDRQTFCDYLQFQLDVYEEDPSINPPEYAEAIRQYLAEHGPGPKSDPELHAEFNKARIAGFRGLYEEWLRLSHDVQVDIAVTAVNAHQFTTAHETLGYLLQIESELAKVGE